MSFACAYYGNIVDLWKFLYQSKVTIDFGSNQTSLHNLYGGGYCPKGIKLKRGFYNNYEFDKVKKNKNMFNKLVKKSLQEQIKWIKSHVDQEMFFFEYGNSLIFEIQNLKLKINEGGKNKNLNTFLINKSFPSYIKI